MMLSCSFNFDSISSPLSVRLLRYWNPSDGYFDLHFVLSFFLWARTKKNTEEIFSIFHRIAFGRLWIFVCFCKWAYVPNTDLLASFCTTVKLSCRIMLGKWVFTFHLNLDSSSEIESESACGHDFKCECFSHEFQIFSISIQMDCAAARKIAGKVRAR